MDTAAYLRILARSDRANGSRVASMVAGGSLQLLACSNGVAGVTAARNGRGEGHRRLLDTLHLGGFWWQLDFRKPASMEKKGLMLLPLIFTDITVLPLSAFPYFRGNCSFATIAGGLGFQKNYKNAILKAALVVPQYYNIATSFWHLEKKIY
ncbi:hypothetical protein GH714_030664 [Hevea brasiliensis]|uniref:Uncharacterized protein n=1 Tax=Hevea brasiliensis TaxID=3981 RepID=A0A6A6N9A3_HEVBR|nr:hypothetical protein GH714_030664 [Hevea brasiliensis]